MWKRTAKGLTLTFHLAGINDQNFLMRDDQTGTFWQQISGRAISGPLSGSQLELVYSDELTFGLWSKLAPAGTVLAPVAKYADDYETKDWEKQMAKARTVIAFPKTALKSRDLVLGVEAFGASRAYLVDRILKETLVVDRIAGHPVLVLVGTDKKSIRVFQPALQNGETASDYYRKVDAGADPLGALFLDSATGSEWNFDGCAIDGKRKGECMAHVPSVKDYWFDWRKYHPATSVFSR